MFAIERKVLTFFLKDIGCEESSIKGLIDNSRIISRKIDHVGFFTKIKMQGLDFDKIIVSPWGNVGGKTRTGLDVTFLIFSEKDKKELLIEGAIFENNGYPQIEEDYDIFALQIDDP